MDTRLRHSRVIEDWRALVAAEEDTGRIPLPALDSLVWEGDRPLSIALVAPDIAPGGLHAFVDVERIPAAERLVAESLIQTLSQLVRSAARLKGPENLIAILHQGGLGYEFRFADDEAVELYALPEAVQPLAWSLIKALVTVGAKYPDLTASTVESADNSARARTWLR